MYICDAHCISNHPRCDLRSDGRGEREEERGRTRNSFSNNRTFDSLASETSISSRKDLTAGDSSNRMKNSFMYADNKCCTISTSANRTRLVS